MTAPVQAWPRLGWGLALGLILGLVYGFLRPLRRKHSWPSDLIFVGTAFCGWLYLSFGVCRGDIRMGATAALGLGALTWEMTVGRLLRRPFDLFWRAIGRIFTLVYLPFSAFLKIIRKICKKVFASAKKRGTIDWRWCRNRRHRSGGNKNEKTGQTLF